MKEARTFGDWPSDVAVLADALGIERFGVIGWSSGGPYAGACAALMPARLTGVGLVHSRAPAQWNVAERPDAYEELSDEEKAEFDLAQTDPHAAARLVASNQAESMADMRDHPEGLYNFLKTEGDSWFFNDPSRMISFDAARRECFRQGMDGYRWEAMDVWMPWGFRLTDISMAVHVWHGAQDPLVKQVHIDFIASRIPNCKVVVWPDCGHIGIAKHWNEILEAAT